MRRIGPSTWFTQVASFPSKNHLGSNMVIVVIVTGIIIVILILKVNIVMDCGITWCGLLLEGRVCECRRDALESANSDEEHGQDDNEDGDGDDNHLEDLSSNGCDHAEMSRAGRFGHHLGCKITQMQC